MIKINDSFVLNVIIDDVTQDSYIPRSRVSVSVINKINNNLFAFMSWKNFASRRPGTFVLWPSRGAVRK